jgi:hypothetical protein
MKITFTRKNYIEIKKKLFKHKIINSILFMQLSEGFVSIYAIR